MAFRFRKKDRSVRHALRRIVREQIDNAVSAIEDEDHDSVKAIHEVRRRCKNVRGLLRLVRGAFEPFAEEDESFRETAHLLGGLRDASVLRDTFDRLTRKSGLVDNGWHHAFRSGLVAQAEAAEKALDPRLRLGEAGALLREARRRAGDWALSAEGWEAIGPGLEHTYARARTMFAEVGENPSVSLHHELRKHVRHHWNHMRLLRPVDAKFVAPRIELAGEFAERLGRHHDLAVFERTLRGDPDAFGSDREVEAILVLARRYRTMLEEQCHRHGRKLLALEVEDLGKRLGDSWDKWTAQRWK